MAEFRGRYVVPLLPEFLRRYPKIHPDWRFESRQVDLIAEDLMLRSAEALTLRRRRLAHARAVAHHCGCLAGLSEGPDAAIRPDRACRVRRYRPALDAQRQVTARIMRNAAGDAMEVPQPATLAFDDPEAMCRAALLGLGVTLIAVPHALPHLESGALVRLIPNWYSDAGPISIYYATRNLLPAKTRGSSISWPRHSAATASRTLRRKSRVTRRVKLAPPGRRFRAVRAQAPARNHPRRATASIRRLSKLAHSFAWTRTISV